MWDLHEKWNERYPIEDLSEQAAMEKGAREYQYWDYKQKQPLRDWGPDGEEELRFRDTSFLSKKELE